uniref:Uncharacterized protein n=1 Tax=Rhizophora mucronata TaxID=61149 RepID=A0A2P2NSX2_RHIMU
MKEQKIYLNFAQRTLKPNKVMPPLQLDEREDMMSSTLHKETQMFLT